jgi:hypothetical protein
LGNSYEAVYRRAAEALEANVEQAKDTGRDQHGLRQRENVDEAACCSYQGAGAALDEARLERGCDEGLLDYWIERIEEESHSAEWREIYGNLEPIASSVAAEKGGLSECAVVEETLGPFRTGVAGTWPRVDEVSQAEHTVSAKKTGAAEE